ncbi:hypothetical protein QM588_20340 [Rhodococcus sp. IEGM 1354]|uniref:hypothetical protein n=1 Tax=Rhodococcus sp. IEGM 1354 TaxID=3047088 RepID=UPI0024B6DA6B|nr:hypothetical protein [Rhodococcus sp. IEGM 1354]MDI9932774.1 hypothetical protein [Rhodococcus sp. IEGM 1354]
MRGHRVCVDVGRPGAEPMIPKFFHRLCDDAAAFPPGNAPLDVAAAQHLEYRASSFADLVGPLVVPMDRVHELVLGARMEVALTAPAGPGSVEAGLRVADRTAGVTVVAVDVAVPEGTSIDALRNITQDIDIYVEIPRDSRRDDIFDAVDEFGYRATFRTGGDTADLYPSEQELAASIYEAAQREVHFKATASSHQAARNTDPHSGFEHHGFLNVILAAQAAHSGARVGELQKILAIRDADVLAGLVAGIEGQRVFASFGACSIREPLDDLVGLGLVPPQ